MLLVVGCARTAIPEPAVRRSPVIAEPPSALPSADAVLRNVEDRYSKCSTYRDSGSVLRSLRNERDTESDLRVVAFRTAFRRQGGQFRFDYEDSGGEFASPARIVIWRPGFGPSLSWWTIKPKETRQGPLVEALHSFAGVSGGLTALAPRWLVDGTRPLFASNYRVLGEEAVRGEPCLKLESTDTKNRTVTFWFRKADYAMLRSAERGVIPPRPEAAISERLRNSLQPEELQVLLEVSKLRLFTESVLEVEPTFDGPLDEHWFQFSPPALSLAPHG